MISDICQIFEFFSNSINQDKKGFTSIDVWDNINTSISRIFSINNIIENEILIEKKPTKFKIDEYEKSISPIVDYNPNVYSVILSDVIKISFIQLYPNIICNLIEEENLEATTTFKKYYYLVKIKEEIKKLLSNNGWMCFKIYINYFYGKLDDVSKFKVTFIQNLISKRISKYSSFLYIDTDYIFMRDDINEINNIKNDLNIIGIPYDIEYYKKFIILGKKRIIAIKDGYITGFPMEK